MKTAAILSLLPLALALPGQKRSGGSAPILKPRDVEALLENNYIVKMKDDVSQASIDHVDELFEGEAYQKWDADKQFKGLAAQISAEALEIIAELEDVEYIEQDAIIKIDYVPEEVSTPETAKRALTSQTAASWGLGPGSGVCAYVIDTGILTSHSQFGGRATFLANYADSSNTDGNGHGTHVAGTIGGSTYGVSKQVTLYAVKVLDSSGSGTNSGVISGINYVATDAPKRSCSSVANMSLGGSKSTAVNSAAVALVRAGVFLAVAAGNSAANANTFSPASETTACTVGATTSSDAFASYSNYGNIVDILAPGSSIVSSYIGSTSATATLSGTSMASPHVAGLGAYFLALQGSMTPAALCTYIRNNAISGVITGVPSGTPNLLAYNGAA
ncbi:proteinase T [Diaporthe helianthi]|uniref:Proteinase T n=1 Tax=Diaporthe helianthi TaxID=158607 RepID=A0A2P5HJ56_DIAHE|nr:proteinase T [Diaporthe helianthi]